MSEQAQAILAGIQAQLQRNLAWLEAESPGLRQALDAPSPRSVGIDVDEHGQVVVRIESPEFGSAATPLAALRQEADARIREMAGPQRAAWSIASEPRLSAWLEHGRIVSALDEHFILREYGEEYCSGLYRQLHDKVRAVRGDKPYTATPQFGPGFIPIVVVVGAVEGWQLDKMVELYDVRHLILVDTYPAGMKLSLCFTDFPALAQRFAQDGRKLTLLLDQNPRELARKLLDEVQSCWPAYCCHGLVNFTGIYIRQDLEELKSAFADCLTGALNGWGFIEDELASLRHTRCNLLAQQLPVCQALPELPAGCSAIICGSGPSLGPAIELIKANRAAAVVFSCGTALMHLQRAGIVPDFHIEIERLASTPDYLRLQAPGELLGQLRLIAPALIYPEVVDVCGQVWLLAKENDVGSHLLLAGLPTFQTSPTVTNCALELCVASGFSNIVLCGVDYGWVDDKHHHAPDTVYGEVDEVTLSKSGQAAKIRNVYQEHEIVTVRGNFRATVRTDTVFNYARLGAERTIAAAGGVRVFNTADGARIAGAEPCRADELCLAPSALSPAQIIEGMGRSFSPVPAARLEQADDAFRRSLKAFLDAVRAKVPAQLASRKELLAMLAGLRVDLPPPDASQRLGWEFAWGSLVLFLMHLYITACALEDEADAAALAVQARAWMLELIDIAEQAGARLQTWPATHRPVVRA